MKVISNDKIYNVKNCKSFKDKLFGFMFKKKKLKYGLLFNNCNLHTFFCFQNLDIIYLDKYLNIVKILKDVKPNKIILKDKKGKYIIEFSSNLINLDNIKIEND